MPAESIASLAGDFDRLFAVGAILFGLAAVAALAFRLRLRVARGRKLSSRAEADRSVRRFAQARLQLAVESERKMRAQNRLLDEALNTMSQGLCMFDTTGRLLLCNDRYLEMYGLAREAITPETTLRDLLVLRAAAGTFDSDPDRYIADLRQGLLLGKPMTTMIELTGGRIFSVVNQPRADRGWVATHEDITERRRAEQRIAYMAHHDALTNLPNRAAFNERLAATFKAAAKTRRPFAILSIDLDRFKEVNDMFGHSAGDALLRTLSGRLAAAAGGQFLARVGGDEFMLIIADGPQPATAEAVANRLLKELGEEHDFGGQQVGGGLSIGIAICPTDGTDASTLLSNADAALYRAKAEGRAAIRFFEPEMDRRLRERVTLRHELRSAVERGELLLHYQPQARMGGEIIGFEALARWRHPTRGLIAPSDFIPIAEETGLITTIGEWVLREACREAASWRRPLRIAINLSPMQFRRGDLARVVHSVLLETGLAPARLDLEVTESVLIGDFTRAVATLRRLKALGVRIAMDDFGSGYSSLSYLQSFPFDKIKIDQAFISNLERNPQSATIVRAVIGLARGLNLPVAAEGVESANQLAFLAHEACDEVQGFLIGRPAPIEDYAETVGRAKRPAKAVAG